MRNQIHKKKDKKKKHRRRVRIEDSDSSDSWIWFLLFFCQVHSPYFTTPTNKFLLFFLQKNISCPEHTYFFVPNVQK